MFAEICNFWLNCLHTKILNEECLLNLTYNLSKNILVSRPRMCNVTYFNSSHPERLCSLNIRGRFQVLPNFARQTQRFCHSFLLIDPTTLVKFHTQKHFITFTINFYKRIFFGRDKLYLRILYMKSEFSNLMIPFIYIALNECIYRWLSLFVCLGSANDCYCINNWDFPYRYKKL